MLPPLARVAALLASGTPEAWSQSLAVLVEAVGGDAAMAIAVGVRLGGVGIMPAHATSEEALRAAGFADAWVYRSPRGLVAVAARGDRRLDLKLLDEATPTIELALIAREANGRVEGELARRRELEERIVELERQSTVGLVAAAVAHDLSAPISAMLMEVADIRRAALELGLHLAESGPVLTSLVADITELSENCAESADRARQLLVDFRAAAHPGGEELVVEVNVADALASSVRLVAPLCRYRARLEQKIQPGLPIIRGSRKRLKQVFTNLLLNAIHAAGERGDGAGLVEARATASPREIIVEIVDNGGGIPADLRERIFEPFFTTKPAGVGTGLGLAIVREIVRAHEGRVELETSVGRGSTFRVCLPIAPAGDRPETDRSKQGKDAAAAAGQRAVC